MQNSNEARGVVVASPSRGVAIGPRVSGKWYNTWNEDYKFSFCVDGGILCECRAI